MFTNFKRIFNFAITDFYRNKGISIAAIFVLSITTLAITGVFFIHGISSFLISSVQNKIDITAYFQADTEEQDILAAKDQILQSSPDIKSVEYVSKEAALADFNEKHKDDPVFLNALGEVGENPFLPALNIMTNGDTAQYEKVAQVLESSSFSNLIEKVDFSEKKDTIEKVFSITSKANRFGLGLGAFLVIIVILVVFNTIKLMITSSKEEIMTMRIVGASNWFVRGPFVVEGALFGLVAFVISFLVTMVAAYFMSKGFSVMLPGFNMFEFFVSNFWWIILIQLASSVVLGAVVSFIGVRKYLKV